MFDFLKPEDGSAQRYDDRLKEFRRRNIPFSKHHFWWLIHNCFAHPLIGVAPVQWAFDFHDYTSRKINAEV